MMRFSKSDKKLLQKVAIQLCIVLIIINLVMIVAADQPLSAAFAPARRVPIYSVQREDKTIAISFDAAWGDDKTFKILDILDEFQIKTTFFLVGFWVDKYEADVTEIHARGHEVQNHSTTHPNMSQLQYGQMVNELSVTAEKIEKITGVRPTLFRPPFGDYSNAVLQACDETGHTAIQWSVDSLDWKSLGIEPMVNRVTQNVQPGSIVLFHNNSDYIVEALPIVLQRLVAEGYTIVPVSQLLHTGAYTIDHAGMQIPAE